MVSTGARDLTSHLLASLPKRMAFERRPSEAEMKNETCKYNLPELPDAVVLMSEQNKDNKAVVKWSGAYPIPQIGDEVFINFNELGAGTVESYFTEHSYLGLTVKLANPPAWHVRQTKDHWYAGKALVFGQEIKR